MFRRKIYPYLFGITYVRLILALAACTQAGAPQAPAGPAVLRIAVLPILETLPMYAAQQEGLFAKHNVVVEFIPVASAPERDQLLAAEQADGIINEALSTALYNKDDVRVQIVRYARVATPNQALFSILAAGNSGISSVEDLKGIEIGISEGTIIEYLTDRLLQAEGFAPEEIETVAIPKIPDRVALLGSGELLAGMLPEPATSLAVQQGATVILDDTNHPEFSYSTITFRKSVIDQHPESIRGFLAAIEEAIGLINADPSKFSALLGEQKLVPPSLAGTFTVPTFGTAGVPSQEQWQDVLDWAKDNGLLSADLPYQDSVNASFLP